MRTDASAHSALVLHARDRAELAAELLASLDGLSEAEAEALWEAEAQRRREDLRSGRATAVESARVADRVSQLLR